MKKNASLRREVSARSHLLVRQLEYRFAQISLGADVLNLTASIGMAPIQQVAEAMDADLSLLPSSPGKSTDVLIALLENTRIDPIKREGMFNRAEQPLSWCLGLVMVNKPTTVPEVNQAVHEVLNEITGGLLGEHRPLTVLERCGIHAPIDGGVHD